MARPPRWGGVSIVLGLVLLLAFAASAGEQKRKPKFTISKETTYATKPVDKDGYIDYAAALNERLKVGVTPANNALVPLMKAFGPRPEGGKLPVEFWRLLGIDELADPGNYWRSCDRYMKEELKLDPTLFLDHWDRVSQRPWTGKHFPHYAAWLKANEAQLALAVEATKRTRYFHPLVVGQKDQGLLSAPVPAVQKCRELAYALVMRAMQRLGERKYDEAWQDLLACH